jgi:predicted Zn-dependent protease
MDLNQIEEGEKVFARALEALAAGETPAALALLERAFKLQDNPAWLSYLGYCIAKERGQVKKGSELCHEALKAQPDNPVHYLNLAKVQVIAGQKSAALESLRKGMALGGTAETAALLGRLGTRKPPVLPFLSRDHFLNKYLGMILHRLRLR